MSARCSQCPNVIPNGQSPEIIIIHVRTVRQTDLVMKRDPRPWKRPVKVAIDRERLEAAQEVKVCTSCADVLLARIEANGGVPENTGEPVKAYVHDHCPNVKAHPISETEWKRLLPPKRGSKSEEEE